MLAIPRHIVNLPLQVYSIIIKSIKDKEVVKGKSIDEFEKEFAAYAGTKYALGVSSARSAIAVVMKALGLAKTDEIIMPAYTFHMVPVLLKALGFKPVFVDVEPDTGNINPDLIAGKITSKTKAILVTHMSGQPCRFDRIAAIASEYNLVIVEDCAHALGAEYHSKKTGSLGAAGVFSFGPGKAIPCFGGGMITTSDHSLYLKLKEIAAGFTVPSAGDIFKKAILTLLYYFFTQRKFFTYFTYPGIRVLDLMKSSSVDNVLKNETAMAYDKAGKAASLANLQAALGLFQLSRVDSVNDKLLNNSCFYAKQLAGLNKIKIPGVIEGTKCPHLYYKIRAKNVKELRSFLLKKGVDTKADDMSLCPALPEFGSQGDDYPAARSIQAQAIEIPSNCLLRQEDLEYIAKCLKEADSRL